MALTPEPGDGTPDPSWLEEWKPFQDLKLFWALSLVTFNAANLLTVSGAQLAAAATAAPASTSSPDAN